MLTQAERKFILNHAYIPEHSVGLMTNLSGGEPFLIEDYFCCCKNRWVIFIGYPLQHDFKRAEFEFVLEKLKKKLQPDRISLIAPELSKFFLTACSETESDFYYTLDVRSPVLGSNVKRNLRKAARFLSIERADFMGDPHRELMQAFMQRAQLPPRVQALLLTMPQFVSSEDNARVLNAWDSQGKLAAFYVIDLAAKNFASYIIGCYSKENYVLGASDLLLSELISICSQYDKRYIHLGLGISDGIRRFKEKWGAKPTRRYEMCEWTRGHRPMTGQGDEPANPLYQKALTVALRILLRRDHSRADLTRKLNQRGFDQEIVERVVAECQRLDYLNDERAARVLINHFRRKGFGSKRIRLEAVRKGLQRELIEALLRQSVSEETERACAERVLQKSIRKFQSEKDALKRRAKVYRFLYARGFPENVISDLVRSLD
jgi:SOS response regulatory protein OraA/RecX